MNSLGDMGYRRGHCLSSVYVILFLVNVLACGYADHQSKRYLLYSVNPPEGFNLRRDVYVRVANLVRKLREQEDWTLVLPPWPHLYHWKTAVDQSGMPWERFFDVPSLNRYIPCVEFEEFLKISEGIIDEVMYLQQYAEGWGESWEEKLDERPCIDQPRYREVSSGHWEGIMLGRTDLKARSFKCVSVQGFVSILVPELASKSSHIRSVLVERFEHLLHTQFGGVEYWAARKSMVYSRHLRVEGNQFMKDKLDYDPREGDGRTKPRRGGGDFMSVHLRRLDYLYAHPDAVPSLEGAAAQLNQLMKEQHLEKVFLTSDAPVEEKLILKELVKGLVWYETSEGKTRQYGDGGVAIINQWIASHGQYFIGTAESTFSFRIREDRQFMGFSRESTFNNMCGPSSNEKDPHSCKASTYWKMVEVPESMFSAKVTKATHQEL